MIEEVKAKKLNPIPDERRWLMEILPYNWILTPGEKAWMKLVLGSWLLVAGE